MQYDNKTCNRVIKSLTKKQSNKKDEQTKKHFVLILILSLSLTSTSLSTETTIVINYRSTVLNLLRQLKISVKLIRYVFSSGFTLQEVDEFGSCQS